MKYQITLIVISFLFLACSGSKTKKDEAPLFFAPKIMKVEGPQLPLSRAVLYFPFGSGDELPGEEGATWLLTRWMEAGTLGLMSADYNRALLSLGAVLSTKIYPRFTLMTVEAPNDKFDQAWGLLIEKIRTPKLDISDFQTAKNHYLAFKKGHLQSSIEAGRQLSEVILYAGTKGAQLEFGKLESIEKLDFTSLKDFYEKTFAKGPSTVLVSDGIPLTTEAHLKKTLEKWQAPFAIVQNATWDKPGRRLIILERPASTQTYLFFVKPGPMPGTRDHSLVALATQILGSNGGNSSLLFDKLRADKGLTYHASLQASKSPYRSHIMGLTFGDNNKIEELLSNYLQVWDEFHVSEDFKQAQLQEASIAFRATIERENSDTLRSLMQAAAESFSVWGKTEVNWQNATLNIDSFLRAKAKWLGTDNLTVLAIGDSGLVKEKLERAMGKDVQVRILPQDSDWDAMNNLMSTF